MSFLAKEIIKQEHISKSWTIMNMILALVMLGNQLKKEMVNVNVVAMRKNLKSFSLLLTEQVVKEPAVVEEEEQLVLADLRVVIVGTAITAMTVIMMYIVHWGASDFYQRILGD